MGCVATGAMVDYLLHKYDPGKLMVPLGGRQHADYLQVMALDTAVQLAAARPLWVHSCTHMNTSQDMADDYGKGRIGCPYAAM